MALSRVKVWSAGEILYALDLNSEFNNVLNNALSLISPLTASLNAGGFKLTNYGGTDAPSAANDVPNLVYYSASNGSSKVGFIQSGTGAVARTAQAKLRDVVHASDFGVTGDGVTDDTTAVAAALVAAAGRTLLITGTPLISAKLAIALKIHLLFDGGAGLTSSDKASSYFIKGAAMTTAAVDITASGVIWDGGGVVCNAGNTGDGIAVLANSTTLRNVQVTGAGNDGIRHGSDSGVNANSCLFEMCRSNSNGRHGFFTRDSGSNNNVTTFLSCGAQSNTQDGFRNGIAGSPVQGSNNHFINCLGENNTGQGINIVGGTSCKVDGGDYEANTAGQILIGVDAKYTVLDNINTGFTVVDNGYYTKRLDRYQDNLITFTPAFRGASGATKTVTAVTISGSTATATSAAHGYSNSDTIFHGSGWPNGNLAGAFVISNVAANTYDFTMSSVTNITGSAQLILPQATSNINASFFTTGVAEYYTGITHTGKLGIIINQNSANLASLYDTISGVPGAAAQFNAAGLSATADIIFRFEYLMDRVN